MRTRDVNWDDDVYADTITTDEEPSVWFSVVDFAAQTSAPLSNPKVGQPCLVFVANFGKSLYNGGLYGWRRAIINAMNPSSVTVTLVDFGKVISVHRCMWSIRRIRRDLCQIPSRIRRLYGPSVVPVSGRTWLVDDGAFARNFTLGKICTLTSVGDVSLSLENGLDWFLTMEKFEKTAFA
ncbi:hypothetical protein DAPPUDRAFT_263250 [Daphnia pulex]|uniref:Uncharacterized protein n=1 Tax=Daphnia pulex TaxID=6669 RepID=E9HPF3_DAPPU|nr:hypothetical protein DAPPUDRAFT_263250 [Daphnia pulex]|eukprot:EFX66372.1 hypothetical protein DAPPUDRAFT_263250 [Daphnia pulex]